MPPALLPQLLQARQFKCPHCKATQALPENLLPSQQPGGYLPPSNNGAVKKTALMYMCPAKHNTAWREQQFTSTSQADQALVEEFLTLWA